MVLPDVQVGARVALDVPVPMRDGTVLRANVFAPDGAGPWPVLLTRTPYGKDEPEHLTWTGVDPLHAVRQGFIVVVQDVRGRFASDGAWEPYRFEREDGFDTVQWAAALPDSNGRVGMYSASYCANVQWLAAGERPPGLGAIAPGFTWADPEDGLVSRGGAVEWGLALRWALENGADTLARAALDDAEADRRIDALTDEWDAIDRRAFWELPVPASPVLARHGVPDLGAVPAIDDPTSAGACDVRDLYGSVQVPSFHSAGWYDIFVQGTLDNYAATVAAGRDARLVVGPWTHLTFADPVGERLFGARAGRAAAAHPDGDWQDEQLAWFRRRLTPDGAGSPQDAASPVRLFVMGRNVWRDEPAWPLARAVQQRWFLRADATLSPDGPDRAEEPSTFVSDPADPVPTSGGNGVLSVSHASGPVDQAAVERRDDVLVFTSAPLPHDLEVTGRVRVMLHAESDTPSADWVARLCDVDPEGHSYNLCDGVTRVATDARRRRRVEIDLWSTSNVFLRGHRIRVQVTGSNFPRWDRNLHTGDQRAGDACVARQAVYHGADDPSWIELPVIP